MNTYKVVARCLDRKTRILYVLAYSHTEAQQLMELNIKKAFVRITTIRIK